MKGEEREGNTETPVPGNRTVKRSWENRVLIGGKNSINLMYFFFNSTITCLNVDEMIHK